LNSRTWKIFIALAAVAVAQCTTDHTRRGYLRTIAQTYASPPGRVAIVIPGFGVTRLYDPATERYVWGTGRNTFKTHYADDLDLPLGDDGTIGRDRLLPRGYTGSRGPINIGWQLTVALEKFGGYTRDVDVFGFEYDWRLPSRENARRLGELVDRVGRGRKVDLITHSAGALIALTYVKLGGGADKVEHLILIAPAQRGVLDAFRVFVKPERFIRREFSPPMVATWPFITELLPEDGRIFVDDDRDLWQPETWRSLVTLDEPHRRAFERSLRAARAFRDQLRDAPLPRTVDVHVLAGDCVATATRLRANYDVAASEPGDGTVPVSSVGAEAMLFCDGHQGIAADPNVHRAILRILRN
jgi:hypothetical protein